MNKLFVWIRSDLESMTPGKAAAQVAHAASQAAYLIANESDGVRGAASYRKWEQDASQERNAHSRFPDRAFCGFGTTIVLDGGDGDQLERDFYQYLSDADMFRSGLIVDPSYPVRDGRVTHLLEMLTCLWAFGDPDINPSLDSVVKRYKLYNGNHTKRV